MASAVRAYLAARPVYRFKDDFKGIVVKAVVSDIAVEGDTLAIALSLVNVTVMTATCAFVLLLPLFLIVWLASHPSWGAADGGHRGG